MKLIKRLEDRKKRLERIKVLAKKHVLFVPYKISSIEKQILKRFGEVSSTKLAKELGINRSYIYAVIEKFNRRYTIKELQFQDANRIK